MSRRRTDGAEHLYAYFDRDAGIVWIPVGHSQDPFDQATPWGSYTYDGSSGKKVGFEIWASAELLPADLLDHIPAPAEHGPAPIGGTYRSSPYWDREVDIAWMPTSHHDGDIYGDRRSWGVVSRNRRSDSIRALEIWTASSIFPAEILEAFPDPGGPGTD